MRNGIFNYKAEAHKLAIADKRLEEIVAQVRQEFGGDDLLSELHILRALRAEARQLPTNVQK